ncbi:hypothetical protein AYL99_11626 [Fonsecaea erecta]|uniref:Uncharacterized protein n=1 Tax=Fonsecaea erecta TaxID=1367422 RepID=A0A178Z3J1_9EURO|nr:hypothetical protein AYL99_11626 [Fonsecaea erecta]OAP54091.1 hypothetical protein AYL99_11626 [Fonsecaea erecta]
MDGLPRPKDKNTAKVRLTNALSAKALTVSPAIVRMKEAIKWLGVSGARMTSQAMDKDSKEIEEFDFLLINGEEDDLEERRVPGIVLDWTR